ncbi:MAG: hypothetical protein PUI16_11370, partial [Clostridia bacterium]|nr:hypothetical protein [Clostridia bacterium]MDY5556050.1 hypothetical protein [Blautia sp.]
MGLMDREYMNRTPEERELEYAAKKRKAQAHQKPQSTAERKHQERLQEMNRLMAKGESMTKADKKRLDRIFAENRAYMEHTSDSHSKSGIILIIIVTIVVLPLLIYNFYPEVFISLIQ